MKDANTRERILQSMFIDIRKNGFQGLRADKVVADMGITKGALYHYFDGKQAIGTAVLDEIIRPAYLQFYQRLDQAAGNPISLLLEHIQYLVDNATDEDVALGCPLNNLIQEMSPLDEAFRVRMKGIVDTIQQSVAAALQRGKSAGFIRPDVDCEAMGRFFFSAIEGSYALAKVTKNRQDFADNMSILATVMTRLQN